MGTESKTARAVLRLDPQFIRIPREYFERVRPLLRQRTHITYEALLLECGGWDRPVAIATIARHVATDRQNVAKEIRELERVGLIRSKWFGPKQSPHAQRAVEFPADFGAVVRALVGSKAVGRNDLQSVGRNDPDPSLARSPRSFQRGSGASGTSTISDPPQPPRRAGRREGTAFGEAVRIATGAPGERQVGPRLARNELHRLEQGLLAKALDPELVKHAAEQYAASSGPWERSATLMHGVTAILDDPKSWAARLEPTEPKTATRAVVKAAPEPATRLPAAELARLGAAFLSQPAAARRSRS